MKTIYLDYAAATPVDPAVLAAMEPYFAKQFYNPSASYLAARAVRQDLQAARVAIAQDLGVRPAEIVFTAGATEANNLAIQGVMRRYPEGEVLTSAIEHDSVLAPAKLFKTRQIPVDKRGIINLQKLASMINDKTVLVSVMLVNNELGTIQPLREIAQMLNKSSISRKSKLPLYLHTDAAQAPLFLDLHVARLGVDLMTINGGKIYGPKRSGVLYVKAGLQLEPLIVGGGQELGRRSGTENVPASIGLAKALTLAQQNRKDCAQEIGQLRVLFMEGLKAKLPTAQLNGSAQHSAPHILSVSFAGVDNEKLMMQLDELGVQAAVGSACSASSAEPSHVLKAIGLSTEQARSSLRFSLGKQTSPADIKKTIDLLHQLTVV